MTVYEEVRLAIDMQIESALEFVLLAKLNANGDKFGYWGYFNGRRVWLSRVSHGKTPKSLTISCSGENRLLAKEIWDKRTNAPYPKNYFTDKICYINYELNSNSDRISRLQKRLSETTGHNYLYVRGMLTEAYEYEEKLNRQKNFIKTGDKAKSIILSDYKNYPLVEVISNSGLELLRAGNNKFKMCCPFHKEKTPSFFVDADKNRFNCFGCGEYGDTLDFISKYEKISIIEAAKKLSTKTLDK